MIKRQHSVGLILAVFVALCYGASLVFARMSYDFGSNFYTVVLGRYTLLSLVLCVWLTARRGAVLIAGKRAWQSLVVGGIAFSTSICYLASVAYIPVSTGTLIFYTHPLLTLLLATIFSRERSTKVVVAATVVALLGLTVVLDVSFNSLHPMGLILGSAASITAAVVFVLSAHIMDDIEPVRFTFYLAITGMFLSASLAVGLEAIQLPILTQGWWALGAAVVLNIFGLLGMFISVRLIGPVSTPMVLNIEPLTAIILAMLLLGESMTVVQGVGAGVVILAVLVAQWSRRFSG